MAILLLIRHGVTDQTGRRLYGRSPGIHLSDAGAEEAALLAERLSSMPIAAVYSSPLERCRETAEVIARGRDMPLRTVEDLNEVDYGRWTGRSFARLARTATWRKVRASPSSVRFPGGETLWEVQRRAVRAAEEIAARHPRAAAAVVTHGDVIRLALAHYAGVHIDLFRRLEVGTSSLSAVETGDGDPRILRMNDRGEVGTLGLPPAAPRRARKATTAGDVQG